MDDDLHARLLRRGLARVADDIMRLTLPAIHLTCQQAEEALLPPGASKLGGLPDLPSETPWPEWRGEAMAFIAQIRLDEIVPYDPEDALPHSGLLSFFYATDGEPKGNADDDNPETWKVLHFDGDLTSLLRQPAPATLNDRVHFSACSMTYSRRLTLPPVESVEEMLGLTNQERLAYIDVETSTDLFEQFGDFLDMDHHLLGYPYALDGSPFISCHLAAHHITPQEVEAAGRQWYQHLEEEAAREWCLLLQVYSNEEAGMDWAGGGVLHFCIPKEALVARDFSRVWLEMQFL